jgi:hypothetical protein
MANEDTHAVADGVPVIVLREKFERKVSTFGP